MVQNLAHGKGMPDPMEYDWIQARMIDSFPWDANKVYQLFLGGEPQNRYLVCYENAIVEIDFDFAVTAAQIKKAGRILRELIK